MQRRALNIACVVVLALAAFRAFGIGAAELEPWSGGKTPQLVLKDLRDATHDLANYRGKVVLVNFWATWCEPCRDELPAIRQLQEKFSGRDLAVLTVNLAESAERVQEYLQRFPVNVTVLLDRDSVAMRAWKIRILPASFLIAPDGGIRYNAIGKFDWASDRAAGAVSGLLRARSLGVSARQ